MRDSVLHQALEAFTIDAAAQLSYDTSNGEEIPFELVETEGRHSRPSLYCYRPLVEDFVERRVGVLSALTSYAPAVRALADRERMDAYLTLHGVTDRTGERRRQADQVLRLFLSRVFRDRTEFEFDSQRFQVTYEELERTLLEGRCAVTVVVPLHGLGLDPSTPEIPLSGGLSIVPGDRVPDAPQEAVWGPDDEAQVLAVVTSSVDRAGEHSVAPALERFRSLLTALRLFERGAYSLGTMAWLRIDAGQWRPVPTGSGGRADSLTLVPARQEDELRGFCNLIPRRLPEDGELAWALARFEMGCERPERFQALTDYLAALRALLEPEGPASGRMAQRLAMICAVPEERAELAERTARAISLERAVIAGLAAARPGAHALVDEMAEHLRALLRDTLCGHLDSDLVGVADRLLAREVGDEAALAAPARPRVPVASQEPDPAGEPEEAAGETAAGEPEEAAGETAAGESEEGAGETAAYEHDADPVPDPEPVGAPA